MKAENAPSADTVRRKSTEVPINRDAKNSTDAMAVVIAATECSARSTVPAPASNSGNGEASKNAAKI